MTRNQTIFSYLAITCIALALAGMLLGALLAESTPRDWQPGILPTVQVSPTPTGGWWDDMPAPPSVTPSATPQSNIGRGRARMDADGKRFYLSSGFLRVFPRSSASYSLSQG